MKLQLSADAVRLRLSVAEFREIRAGRSVALVSPLPGAGAITLDVAAGEHLAWTAVPGGMPGQGGRIDLRLPMQDLAALEARLPCRDGLLYGMDVGSGRPVRLTVDVDVRDPEGRRPAAR